jgi:hypothetical protein
MKAIKSVDYVYNAQGEVAQANVTYVDGTMEAFASKAKLIEVQDQLKFQQRQFLVE